MDELSKDSDYDFSAKATEILGASTRGIPRLSAGDLTVETVDSSKDAPEHIVMTATWIAGTQASFTTDRYHRPDAGEAATQFGRVIGAFLLAPLNRMAIGVDRSFRIIRQEISKWNLKVLDDHEPLRLWRVPEDVDTDPFWTAEYGPYLRSSATAPRIDRYQIPVVESEPDQPHSGQPSPDATRFLIAESHWAEEFPAPSYRELANWALRGLPAAVVTTVATTRGPTGLAILLAYPIIQLFIQILALAAALPSDWIKKRVSEVQQAIQESLGDPYRLTQDPISAARIVSQTRRDLDWILGRCSRVVVVAHSQGAAVATAALQRIGASRRRVSALITLGSGLTKLVSLEEDLAIDRESFESDHTHGFPEADGSDSGPQTLERFALADPASRQSRGTAMRLSITASIWVLASALTALLVRPFLLRNGFPPNTARYLLMTSLVVVVPTLLLTTAASRLIARGFSEETKLSSRWRRQTQPLGRSAHAVVASGTEWFDFYTDKDIVSGNTRIGDDPKKIGREEEWQGAVPIRICNRHSWFRDHVTYFGNTDVFVPAVARILSQVSTKGRGIALWAAVPWKVMQASNQKRRNRWRWLNLFSAVVGLLVVAVGFVIAVPGFLAWLPSRALSENLEYATAPSLSTTAASAGLAVLLLGRYWIHRIGIGLDRQSMRAVVGTGSRFTPMMDVSPGYDDDLYSKLGSIKSYLAEWALDAPAPSRLMKRNESAEVEEYRQRLGSQAPKLLSAAFVAALASILGLVAFLMPLLASSTEVEVSRAAFVEYEQVGISPHQLNCDRPDGLDQISCTGFSLSGRQLLVTMDELEGAAQSFTLYVDGGKVRTTTCLGCP